ncbi:MAG: MFS transporter, partial [Curtobacterium sp.]
MSQPIEFQETRLTPLTDTRARLTGHDVRIMVGVFAAQFGVFTALMAPALVSLAVRIAQITPNAAARNDGLAWALGIGALFAMVANPVFGALSDRTRTRWGRRMPWVAAGFVIGVGGLLVLAFAGGTLGLVVGWCIVQVGFNASYAAVAALMSDMVPEAQRGRFAAVMGVGQYASLIVATGVVSLVVTNTLAMFLVPAIVAAVGVAVLFILVKEPVLDRADVASTDLRSFFTGFWVSPRRHPDFFWACISRFFKTAAQFTLTSYQTYFFIDRFGFTPEGVAGAVALATAISTVMVLVTSVISGWLSDRLGRRKVFIWGAAFFVAVGMLLLCLHVPFAVMMIFIGIIGFAQGLYASVDVAIIVDVLPDKKDAAKDLGLATIAGT